jgi:hypothetical protein
MGDIYEVAARAYINERFAHTYLHDVRGTMQAVFSSIELLLRSAQSGADPLRVERAGDLAKRAIAHHEKSTIEVLKLLTLDRTEVVDIDLNRLVLEVAHFLRNEAAVKGVKITVTSAAEVGVAAEKGKLQTLLIGLLAASFDAMLVGEELQVSTLRKDDYAVVTIGSGAGFEDFLQNKNSRERPQTSFRANDLTFLFAERYLNENGGRLTLDQDGAQRSRLNFHYPCTSFAQARASATEK